MKKLRIPGSNTSAVSTVLAFVLSLCVAGSAEAETIHTVVLDRSESIHQYSDQYQSVLAMQDNDALQVVVLGTDLPPYPSLEVRRAFLEFTIPSLSGMITSTLLLQKYYDAGYSAAVPFEVSVYVPEMDLTLQTFHIPAIPVAEFNTDHTRQRETVAIDISEAVSEFVGQAIGLRLRLSQEGTLGENIFRGAGFEDSHNGIAPWIEIVEVSAAEALQDLLTLMEDLVNDDKIAKSFSNPLAQAIRLVSNDSPRDDKAAVNMLGAFISKVEAQRGKKMTEVIADALIEEAVHLQMFLEQ